MLQTRGVDTAQMDCILVAGFPCIQQTIYAGEGKRRQSLLSQAPSSLFQVGGALWQVHGVLCLFQPFPSVFKIYNCKAESLSLSHWPIINQRIKRKTHLCPVQMRTSFWRALSQKSLRKWSWKWES